MAEEETVTVRSEQDFFSEEYGWIGAYRDYEVRAAVAEMWIADGRAMIAEKKKPVGAINESPGQLIETPEDNLTHETATIKRRKNVRS